MGPNLQNLYETASTKEKVPIPFRNIETNKRKRVVISRIVQPMVKESIEC